MEEVVIVDTLRTPIGSFCGSLSDVSAKDLAKTVMEGIMSKNRLDPHELDEIIVGCVDQPTSAPNIGRIASLELGYPEQLSAYVVSRNCASGMQALVNGAQSIKAGDTQLSLIVGTENMSQIPYIIRGARKGYKMRHQQLTDSLWEMLYDPFAELMMGETAEIIAEEYEITREEQDLFAFHSHRKAIEGQKSFHFEKEIIPVQIPGRRGKEATIILNDEGPSECVSIEGLAKLNPVFKKGGTVTPGNACSTNDGAASSILMSEKKAAELGLKPRAKLRSYAFVGCDPRRMGLGPVFAIPKALEKANLKIQDIEMIEINEAFAAQSLACIKQLKIDPDKVNRYGGAIALGHPLGATGIRLLATLMNGLETEKKKYGIASLCIGGGLGGAIVIENLNL